MNQPKPDPNGALVFNGIDGTTGEYLLPPMTPEELLAHLDGSAAPPVKPVEKPLVTGIDRCDLGQTGWGVIFHEKTDPAVREALAPLLELRGRQAGGLFREYCGADGYGEGEPPGEFLDRIGVAPGPIDPAKVPYYVLLVGGPAEIPYEAQYELDLGCAVGRLCFDTPEEYGRYAQSVVAAETGELVRPRRMSLLGVHNPGDEATRMTCQGLVGLLGEALKDGVGARDGWEIRSHLAQAAGKERFREVLGGSESSALVFAACHGMGFPSEDSRLREQQGALVCQEWPGPGHGGVQPDHRFAAADVDGGAEVAGLVAFCFACYGAGSPAWDYYAMRTPGEDRKPVAPEAMVARLPQRLLGHPNGGALAVVGHVDRAWAWSFVWSSAYQIEAFQSTVTEILEGVPIGAAMEYFGNRHGQLSARLAAELERRHFKQPVDPKRLAGLWTANNDARSYVILGDPAVRLAVEA